MCPIYHASTTLSLGQLSKSYWGCLSVLLFKVFPWLIRPLRKSQAVGRMFALAGCRVALLPWGLLTLRVVFCGLHSFQKHNIFFDVTVALWLPFFFLFFFPPRNKAYCIGSNQVWQWFRQCCTTFFLLLNFCSVCTPAILSCWGRSLLSSQRLLWLWGVILLSDIMYWTIWYFFS